jgi:hypothetical protein
MPSTKAITAESLPEFLEVGNELAKAWSSAAESLWYRGQRNAAWQLRPGEYRFAGLNGDEIRSEFILKGRELLRLLPSTPWEWYFLMQHHGLPTRLLDWTGGSLIALHFALSSNTGNSDAAVWVLDPKALNQWSYGMPELLITGGDFAPDDLPARYLGLVYHKTKLADKPVAIVPPFNSARITAQRGTFTVHGRDVLPLEEQFKGRLTRIVVPKSSVLSMRRQLRSAGISEFTLFPELDGLCRDIRAAEIEGC